MVDVYEKERHFGLRTSSNPMLMLTPKPVMDQNHRSQLITQGFELTRQHIIDLAPNTRLIIG